MKLFGKIFLRVMLGVLVLTQVIFIWFLSESRTQNLEAVNSYESAAVAKKESEMRRGLQKANIARNQREIQDITAVNVFRSIFLSSGALYRDGEELYNATPYEFEQELLKNKYNAKAYHTNVLSAGSVQNTGEKKLLLFTGVVEVDKTGFFYVSYKDVTDIYLRTEELFVRGFCFTLLMLVIIGSILFFGIYRAVRPLTELKKAASAIAEGDYEKRIALPDRGFLYRGKPFRKKSVRPAGKEDEIEALAISFNRMAEKVQLHTEELTRTNEMQRQLLGSLAHELKTPMTAIMGYADTLLTVRLSDRRREQALNYIENECKRLSRLSAKMLELTGLYETGEKTVAFREVKAEELLKKLKNLTEFRLEPKGIRLETSCTPQNLVLRIDEDLMLSLLMNLVDNAYKASLENSVIYVGAKEQGIYVCDHGKGIPSEEICHVTEAFYMVDKSRSKTAGSVGLGLTLCKKIAELHGAALGIDSQEGVGTTVSLIWRGSRQLQSGYSPGKI